MRKLVFLIIIHSVVFAQQNAIQSQYMFSGILINPAFTGSLEALSITSVYRNQWSNIQNSPVIYSLAAHTPLGKNNLSIGAIIGQEELAIFRKTNVAGTLSYHINSRKGGKLYFGIEYGFGHYFADYTKLTQKNSNDPTFAGLGRTTSTVPLLGTGIYYSNKKQYIGISIPQIYSPILFNKSTVDITNHNYLYIHAGSITTLNHHFKYKPSLLLKKSKSKLWFIDINSCIIWRDAVWLGVSVRNFTTFTLLFQCNITDQLKVGYAYEHIFKPNTFTNFNSHELLLHYLFSFEKSKLVSPRYFY